MNAKPDLDKLPSALISCIIEAYTEGSEHRAHVRARLREVRPGVFAIIPFYLREVSGPKVPWQSPEPGGALQIAFAIAGFDDAHSILAWWATQTFAANRRQ
jgi:hypothetical protein